MQRRFSLESETIDTRQGSIGKVFNQYIASENYLFGNGLATSGFPLVHNYDKVSYPHNITIEMLYETGFVGVICYYLPLVIALILFYKERGKVKEDVAILASVLLMFLLYAQTSGNMIGNSYVFIFTGYLF